MRRANDERVPCPYNPEHLVRPSRLPYHYLKCETKPAVEHLYSVCPHNVRHRVLNEDLATHVESCPDNEPPLNWEASNTDDWNDVE